MTGLIIFIFIIGYLAIAFEGSIRINKAAGALITGVLCWTVYILSASDSSLVIDQLAHHIGQISQIIFFLIGAMAIVELIDTHDGFDVITKSIKFTRKSQLLWIIAILSFIFSAVLDNLTTTIVMVSLIRKIIADKKDRWMFAGLIVIAANAGGAWSPIGDVSTTMLWIGNQVTAENIMLTLILPSIACLVIPVLLMQFVFKGGINRVVQEGEQGSLFSTTRRERRIVLISGIALLLFVPVFKMITHLPPFMGMMISLGVMWIIAEFVHKGKSDEDREKFSVAYSLQKIDTPSILFFLGILLAVSALESTEQLRHLAGWMDEAIKNQNIIVIGMGILSAIVDNVPLVAATQGMYDLNTYPTDHYLWEFLAYCTGTGGSILIIGSAAGVAAMGMEKIKFFWYLKKIGWIAFVGYISGALVYILQNKLFG